MMKKTFVLLSSLALGLTACSGAPADQEFSDHGQSIIGGLHANSSFWDHTGGIAILEPGLEQPTHFCSGTLIAPETVVTAKHCVELIQDLGGIQGISFYWVGGPQLDTPLEVIPVAAFEATEVSEGGFVGRGQDVAVVHLDFPSALTPASATPFTPELLGRRMVTVGYGVHSTQGNIDQQRRVGRETVEAVEGSIFGAMFGDLESFVEWVFTGQVTDEDFSEEANSDPFLAELFESEVLLEDHEAVTGLTEGDTQSCNGDSGGPLGLIDSGGGFQTFGVVSGGLNSVRQQCDFGSVFATFGPEVMPFLEAAAQWEDPCGDATEAGTCSGTRVQRCDSNLVEGTRTLEETDCAETGQFCVTTAIGALCGTIDGLTPEPPVTDEESEPPSEEEAAEVQQAVNAALQRLQDAFFRNVR